MERTELFALLANHWPAATLAGAALAGGLGLAASGGWAPKPDFDRLKWQVEEGARANDRAHTDLKEGIGDVKTNVAKLLEGQQRQAEALARIEGPALTRRP